MPNMALLTLARFGIGAPENVMGVSEVRLMYDLTDWINVHCAHLEDINSPNEGADVCMLQRPSEIITNVNLKY